MKREAEETALEEVRGLLEEIREMGKPQVIEHPGDHVSVMAEIRRMAEQARSGRSIVMPAGMGVAMAPSMQQTVATVLSRLMELLGLPQEARAMIFDLARSPVDHELIQVLADWLEDAHLPEGAERIRRLTPEDGDVVILDVAREHWCDEQTKETCKRMMEDIREHASRLGREVMFAILPTGYNLRRLDEKEMSSKGWLRLETIRRTNTQALERLRSEYEKEELLAGRNGDREEMIYAAGARKAVEKMMHALGVRMDMTYQPRQERA